MVIVMHDIDNNTYFEGLNLAMSLGRNWSGLATVDIFRRTFYFSAVT